MEKPKVLIVGSGKFVLNYEFDDLIDSFDVVVRFNGFQKKEVKNAGSKVDIVFCNTSKAAHKIIIEEKNIVKEAQKYILTYYKSVPQAIQRLEKMEKYLESIEMPFETTELRRFEKVLNVRPKGLTNGMMAIIYFLETEKIVAIHGFDYVDPNTKESPIPLRYYDDSNTSDYKGKHDIKKEAKCIEKLIQEERIIELRNLKEK